MEKNELILDAIKNQKLLPLFYHEDKEVCIGVLRALYAAGIRVAEYTARGPNALENFYAMAAVRKESMPGLILGAGTIRHAAQVNDFSEAGADFLVSPMFDASLNDAAYLLKLPWIPGCMTPTEIHEAESAGRTLVKLFPGNVLGPGFVTAIKELFPGMAFMPTGGVTADKENLRSWFTAGVCAVGIGGHLITKEILRNKDFQLLEQKTKELLEWITETGTL
ncbi:MAG: bifunctional 4-hydroxy-2-oxoglutarate aldolase/2-dehydro-3-deoxy-phosphogluconate aldolase [Chitinophagaceae bacterium]|nr:bifunctional 4-hydroxy-2-oxoglutarate aldolase/2-dehydro-3-deoxy-phosphogluconate aldolase [Chitinophagaceae bacterium]